MISIISIFYKTKATFDFLDDQEEEDLDTQNLLILFTIGLLTTLDEYFGGYFNHISKWWTFAAFIFGGGFAWIFGKYVISYLIYWIGKILGGQSKIIDIQTIVAYALLPRLLQLPIMIYLGLIGKYNQLHGTYLYLLLGFYILLNLWTLKISTQGLMRFNKYGLTKAMINQSPYILGILIFNLFLFLK